jgi:SAM-dependent methyltransferase
MWQSYVGAAAQTPTAFDNTYLDVFLNGVLDIGMTPAETTPLLPEMIGYYPTPAHVILALIEQARLSAHDVFYDLGAGLGRVALLVGLLTAAQVKGVEFEPAYCAYAQQRAHNLHLRRVTFINADARAVDYADGSVFFLYTPFTGRLLQEVLVKLRAEACTRTISIATYGACTRDVMQQPWLQPTVQQTFTHDTLAFFSSC